MKVGQAHDIGISEFAKHPQGLQGLEVPALQPVGTRWLQEIRPPFIIMRNPVDIWAAATAKGIEYGYSEGIEVLLKDPNIDAVVPLLLITKNTGIPSYDFIIELTKRYGEKPILVTFSGEEDCMRECKSYLEPRGVPTYAAVEQPFLVLSILNRCRKAMGRTASLSVVAWSAYYITAPKCRAQIRSHRNRVSRSLFSGR